MDKHHYQLTKLSRFLSMVLRHQPTRFPIRLDAQGFADLDEVLHLVHALPNFRWATLRDIDAVLDLPGRARFEMVQTEAGTRRIRALYGHTALRPTYEPVDPPERLYYGAVPEDVDTICREGLKPGERRYVHLTSNPDLAREDALPYTAEPVVLTIDAAAASAAGLRFYHPADEIYLCEAVLPQFIL